MATVLQGLLVPQSSYLPITLWQDQDLPRMQ